jgi:alpha-glucosidase
MIPDPSVSDPHHDGSLVSDPAPALGDAVTVFVRVPAGTRVDGVHVRYTADGEPLFTEAALDRRDARGTWWRAEVGLRNPVVPYRFLLDTPGGARWLTAAGVVAHEVPDATDFRLVAYAPPPGWAADAVIYQIFPDRFARSAAAGDRPPPDWAIPCDWDTPVIGRGPQTPRQFYGGDLDGVAERLDHVAALGANTLYLTPVFPARSNHRYDAAAFDRVDPLLGGDEALARLSGAVHRRGWRLLGDLTTNHTGDAHPWFTAAVSDAGSAERGLYYFDDAGGYESWLGVRTLPKLDWGSAELRRRLVTGPDAVVGRWLRPPYGLDGWRIDVANMTGRRGADAYTPDVAAMVRAASLAARPDALVVAEHCHDGTADLDRDGWHGTMNYGGFTRPVWSWLRGADPVEPGFAAVPGDVPHRDGVAVLATMRAFAALTSWRTLTASWNLVGSHDTPRIRTIVGDPAAVEVAVGLQFTLPGTPMIFAGDELGLRGVNGEDARRPMPWHRPGTWDLATLDRFRRLIGLRHREPALRRGGLRWAHADAHALVFLRETPAGDGLLVLARRAAGRPVRLPGPVEGPAENVYGGAPDLRPVGGTVELPGDGPTFQVWRLG